MPIMICAAKSILPKMWNESIFCALSHMLQSATTMQDKETKYDIIMHRLLIKVIELEYVYKIHFSNQILAPQEFILQYVLPHICILFIVFLWPIYGRVDEILIIDPFKYRVLFRMVIIRLCTFRCNSYWETSERHLF